MRTSIQRTGCTFVEYLRARKVKEACLLLSTDDYPFSVVAHKSGLRTERTLRRAFEKALGVSPRQYKNGQFVHEKKDEVVLTGF